MSKIDSSGLEHGRRGDKIYVVLNGQQIKKDPYRPTNPRSPAQQKHRAKIAFINQLSAQLAEAVNLGFLRLAEEAKKQTPRNAFVKANWDNGALCWNEETAAWELCPERLLLAEGPRHIPAVITAEVEGNLLHITCPDSGLGDMYAVLDDRLYVAVYLPDAQATKLYSGPMRFRTSQGVDPRRHACLRQVPIHLFPPRHRLPRPSPPRPSQPQPLSRHIPLLTVIFSCELYFAVLNNIRIFAD